MDKYILITIHKALQPMDNTNKLYPRGKEDRLQILRLILNEEAEKKTVRSTQANDKSKTNS